MNLLGIAARADLLIPWFRFEAKFSLFSQKMGEMLLVQLTLKTLTPPSPSERV